MTTTIKTPYPYPRVGEETFKGSKWTIFQDGRCHRHSPYTHIVVQAPTGVACDVLRNGFGVDPYEVTCEEHQSTISIHENAEWPEWLFRQRGAVFIVTHDAVGYYANGLWKVPHWKDPDDTRSRW